MPQQRFIRLTGLNPAFRFGLFRLQVRLLVRPPDGDGSPLSIVLQPDESGWLLTSEDLPSETRVLQVVIEDVQGTPLQYVEPPAPGSDFSLSDLAGSDISINDEVAATLAVQPAPAVRRLVRSGRLSVVGQPDFRFDGYTLLASTATGAEESTARGAVADGVRFGTEWSAPVRQDAVAPVLRRLRAVPLRFDGSFQFGFPLEDDVVGWLWLLSGPTSVVGFQGEKRLDDPRADVMLVITGPLDTASPRPGTTPPKTGVATRPSKPALPLDVDETQLVEHPELFSDDPGPFCRPFKNPQRTLGERRFFSVLRVEQPEIARAAGVRLLERLTPRLGRDGALPDGGPIPLPVRGIDLSVRRPMSETIRSPLSSGALSSGRVTPSGRVLIDWEGDLTGNQAVSLAGGHVLEWRVRWRSNGYSLGDVAHTLTLAPRQTKRLVKIGYERHERARRQETVEFGEEIEQETHSSRDYFNALSGELSEWASGQSSASTTGASFGFGAAVAPGVVIGGGAAHGRAQGQSSEEGGRQTAAAEEQSLRDGIRQYGESLRRLESTVVTEMSQSETTEGVSEVIANPNYCHALTVVHYEILRHLRVDTEVGGVAECLFVPFAITPFAPTDDDPKADVRRLLRYRPAIEPRLRKKALGWVLPYLEDALNDFEHSTVPDTSRAEEDITMLRGSIYLEMAIEAVSTSDIDDEVAEETKDQPGRKLSSFVKKLAPKLLPLSPVLDVAAEQIAKSLGLAPPENRERVFQETIAPRIAARFVSELALIAITPSGAEGIPADFTLATPYRHGREVRADFTVSIATLRSRHIRREDIQELRVSASQFLPAHSRVNLTRMAIDFRTENHGRRMSSPRSVSDLVATRPLGNFLTSNVPPHTPPGIDDYLVAGPDGSGASAFFELAPYETRRLRDEILRDIPRLVAHVNDYLHHYHKAIWWSMDPDELYTILDGYALSASSGRSIASIVEQRPMAIVGNSLVFRVSRGAFIGVNGYASLEAARRAYVDDARVSDPMRVSLPTGGLYAQALMDECNACEEHFGGTEWVLDAPQLMPQELDASLLQSRRTEPEHLQPSSLPSSIINLQNAPAPPPPSGLADVFGTLSNADAFRDMAGLAGTQSNARGAMNTAAQLASQFGSQAAALKIAGIGADKAKVAQWKEGVALLKKIKESGFAPAVEQALSETVLGGLGVAQPRTAVSDVSSASRDLRPGAKVTYEKNDADGFERYEIDSSALPADSTVAQAGGAAPGVWTDDDFSGQSAPDVERTESLQTALKVAPIGRTENLSGRHPMTEQLLVWDFGIGSAGLIGAKSPDAIRQLLIERWRRVVNDHTWVRVRVIGFSDYYGKPAMNASLRSLRAQQAIWQGIIPTSAEVLGVGAGEVPRRWRVDGQSHALANGQNLDPYNPARQVWDRLPFRLGEPITVEFYGQPVDAADLLKAGTKVPRLFLYPNASPPTGMTVAASRARNRSVLVWEQYVDVVPPPPTPGPLPTTPEQQLNKDNVNRQFESDPDAVHKHVWNLYRSSGSLCVILAGSVTQALKDAWAEVDQDQLLRRLSWSPIPTGDGLTMARPFPPASDGSPCRSPYITDLRPAIDELFATERDPQEIRAAIKDYAELVIDGIRALNTQLGPTGMFAVSWNPDSPPVRMYKWIREQRNQNGFYRDADLNRIGMETGIDGFNALIEEILGP